MKITITKSNEKKAYEDIILFENEIRSPYVTLVQVGESESSTVTTKISKVGITNIEVVEE